MGNQRERGCKESPEKLMTREIRPYGERRWSEEGGKRTGGKKVGSVSRVRVSR